MFWLKLRSRNGTLIVLRKSSIVGGSGWIFEKTARELVTDTCIATELNCFVQFTHHNLRNFGNIMDRSVFESLRDDNNMAFDLDYKQTSTLYGVLSQSIGSVTCEFTNSSKTSYSYSSTCWMLPEIYTFRANRHFLSRPMPLLDYCNFWQQQIILKQNSTVCTKTSIKRLLLW